MMASPEEKETVEQRYDEITKFLASLKTSEAQNRHIQLQILYYLMKIDEKLEHGISTIPEEMETSL